MDKDDLIYMCETYVLSRRPADALAVMKEMIEQMPDLDRDGRQLFQVVYKQIVDAYRETLRTITSYLEVEQGVGRVEIAAALEKQKNHIIENLIMFCKEGIDVMDQSLLPAVYNVENPAEAQTFLLKFKADLYRYISEFSDETEAASALISAENLYNEAIQICETSLPKSHPISLSCILNASVFQYEQKQNLPFAVEMCENAIKNVDESFQELDPKSQAESRSLIQLMRQNLYNWGKCSEEEEMEE